MLTLNQIDKTIEKYNETILKKSKESMKKLYNDLDLSINEISYYQNLKSILQLENKISLDVSLRLYNVLNNWCNISLSERITYTLVFKVLVNLRR